MALVYDYFQRADNTSLGGAWGAVYSSTDSAATNPGPYTGGIQIKNHAFAPLDSGSDLAISAYTGTVFGNDQWASAQIAAIAAYTSQVAITACSSSAGTSTYTYTLSSGTALIVTQWLTITGMTNAGNNSPTAGFKITGLGAGTFAVANASPGSNESGSTGTGISSSDSTCGVAVRCSADGQNGYLLEIGTNSGAVANNGVAVDHRVYCFELWKIVAGTASSVALLRSGLLTTIPDSVGDVYTLSVVGTILTVYKNGVALLTATDSSIASGSPGIATWCVGGSGEWANPTGYTTGGNSGTQWTNFVAGDGVTGTGVFTDNFHRANVNNLGANWTANPSPDNPLQVSSNFAIGTVLAARNGDYYSAASFPTDQWSEITIATSQSANIGQVSVRQSAAAQTRYFFNTQGPVGTTNTFGLFKLVATVQTGLGATITNQTLALSDIFKISVIGTTITAYRNNVQIIQRTDVDIASGSPGFLCQPGTSLVNEQISLWSGGSAITISGSAGRAGAIVSYTGAKAGAVAADGSGNYVIPDLPAGAYTITPLITGYNFSPVSSAQTVTTAAITGVNFTVSLAATGNAGSLSLRRRKRRDVIS